VRHKRCFSSSFESYGSSPSPPRTSPTRPRARADLRTPRTPVRSRALRPLASPDSLTCRLLSQDVATNEGLSPPAGTRAPILYATSSPTATIYYWIMPRKRVLVEAIDQTQFREFYERRVDEKWATSDNPEMRRLVRRVKDWLPLRPSSRVLDVGCYDGYILARLADALPIQGIGVDIALNALQRAKQAVKQPNVSFVACDSVHLPFPNETFDAVVCSELLEHVPEYGRLLSELARVLRRNGLLYATMPNSLKSVWRPLRGTCRLIDDVEGHLRRPSLGEFVADLAEFGFGLYRYQYRGFAMTALWYRLTVYNPLARRVGRSIVGDSSQSTISHVARFFLYLGMRMYLTIDGLFWRSSGGMGIDALFELRSRNGNEIGTRI
jgi:SAM-dependent methyltransferase